MAAFVEIENVSLRYGAAEGRPHLQAGTDNGARARMLSTPGSRSTVGAPRPAILSEAQERKRASEPARAADKRAPAADSASRR